MTFDRSTMVYPPIDRDFEPVLTIQMKEELLATGKPVPSMTHMPVKNGEVARDYAYCKPGQLHRMDGCRPFPQVSTS